MDPAAASYGTNWTMPPESGNTYNYPFNASGYDPKVYNPYLYKYSRPSDEPGYFVRGESGNPEWKECTPHELDKDFYLSHKIEIDMFIITNKIPVKGNLLSEENEETLSQILVAFEKYQEEQHFKGRIESIKAELLKAGVTDTTGLSEILAKFTTSSGKKPSVGSLPAKDKSVEQLIEGSAITNVLEYLMGTVDEEFQDMFLFTLYQMVRGFVNDDEMNEESKSQEEAFYAHIDEKFPVSSEPLTPQSDPQKEKIVQSAKKNIEKVVNNLNEHTKTLFERGLPEYLNDQYKLFRIFSTSTTPATPSVAATEVEHEGGGKDFKMYGPKTKAGLKSQKVLLKTQREERITSGEYQFKIANEVKRAALKFNAKMEKIIAWSEKQAKLRAMGSGGICFDYPETEEELQNLLKILFTPQELLEMNLLDIPLYVIDNFVNGPAIEAIQRHEESQRAPRNNRSYSRVFLLIWILFYFSSLIKPVEAGPTPSPIPRPRPSYTQLPTASPSATVVSTEVDIRSSGDVAMPFPQNSFQPAIISSTGVILGVNPQWLDVYLNNTNLASLYVPTPTENLLSVNEKYRANMDALQSLYDLQVSLNLDNFVLTLGFKSVSEFFNARMVQVNKETSLDNNDDIRKEFNENQRARVSVTLTPEENAAIESEVEGLRAGYERDIKDAIEAAQNSGKAPYDVVKGLKGAVNIVEAKTLAFRSNWGALSEAQQKQVLKILIDPKLREERREKVNAKLSDKYVQAQLGDRLEPTNPTTMEKVAGVVAGEVTLQIDYQVKQNKVSTNFLEWVGYSTAEQSVEEITHVRLRFIPKDNTKKPSYTVVSFLNPLHTKILQPLFAFASFDMNTMEGQQVIQFILDNKFDIGKLAPAAIAAGKTKSQSMMSTLARSLFLEGAINNNLLMASTLDAFATTIATTAENAMANSGFQLPLPDTVQKGLTNLGYTNPHQQAVAIVQGANTRSIQLFANAQQIEGYRNRTMPNLTVAEFLGQIKEAVGKEAPIVQQVADRIGTDIKKGASNVYGVSTRLGNVAIRGLNETVSIAEDATEGLAMIRQYLGKVGVFGVVAGVGLVFCLPALVPGIFTSLIVPAAGSVGSAAVGLVKTAGPKIIGAGGAVFMGYYFGGNLEAAGMLALIIGIWQRNRIRSGLSSLMGTGVARPPDYAAAGLVVPEYLRCLGLSVPGMRIAIERGLEDGETKSIRELRNVWRMPPANIEILRTHRLAYGGGARLLEDAPRTNSNKALQELQIIGGRRNRFAKTKKYKKRARTGKHKTKNHRLLRKTKKGVRTQASTKAHKHKSRRR